MERHTKIRRWIIYSGVFFLALSTVITIVSSSSRFNAQVAIEPCLAITDVNGDGTVNEGDCTGGGGGGGTTEECIEPVPVGTVTTESTNTAVSTDEQNCACYNLPPFDPAHDGVTESTQQAGVSALNGKKATLDSLWKQFMNDTANPHFEQARKLAALLKGGAASESQMTQLLNAIASGITKTFSDPIYLAKLKNGVIDPVNTVAKIVYESSTLPNEIKHAESDAASEPEEKSKRTVRILEGFKPSFTGFPNNFRLRGFDVNLFNYTVSDGAFESCLKLNLGVATGKHGARVQGLELYGEAKFADRWGGYFRSATSGEVRNELGLFFRF